MAVIDPRNDAVVIRVVYDGPPMAGKTTSVRTLGKGVGGSVVAPEEIGGRTLFFDWLDYTGGLFEGRRIRCQVVTVPGQATLASRRRKLLQGADVVVFVGDSAPQEQSATQSYLEGLRGVLDKVEGPPIGIVLQANKRDRPDAVSLDLLRTMLDRIGARIAVIESVATDGSGIREAFVFAVRLALDRVRELMRTGQLRSMPPEIDNAQDLLAELRRCEGAALELAADSGLVHTRLNDVREPSLAATALEQAVRDNADPVATARPSIWDRTATAQAASGGSSATASGEDRTTRSMLDGARAGAPAPNAVADDTRPPQVPGGDLPSGRIWPPVNGRLLLHAATLEAALLRRHVNGDWVGALGSSWQMHSPAGARFADVDAGHQALVNWARLHAASAHVISNERCIVLSSDGLGGYRLWQIVRAERSLRDEFDAALTDEPAVIAKALVTLTRAFLQAGERFSSAACWLPLSLRNVAALPGGSRFLGTMPDPQCVRPAEPRSQATTMRLLAVQLEYALPELQACRTQALSVLDQMIRVERGAPLDPTHGFARRFLDSAFV